MIRLLHKSSLEVVKMNEVKKEVMELVEKIEAGIDEYTNVNKIIKVLSKALDECKIEKQFALEIDERLGLEYFD